MEIDHRRAGLDFLVKGLRGPSAVDIPGGAGGLPKTSLTVWHPVTTIDRSELVSRIGARPPEALRELEGG